MEVEAHCSRPLLHVLGCESGTVKDVTRRYSSNFLTEVRKLRTDAKWLEKTLAPFKCANDEDERVKKEEAELERKVNEAPRITPSMPWNGTFSSLRKSTHQMHPLSDSPSLARLFTQGNV